MQTPDWSPFEIAKEGERAPPPRSIRGVEGIGDRLRAAAFAEVQARDGFRWAAERFEDASEELRKAWLDLAGMEQKHLDWLLKRMSELGVDAGARPVSTRLWESFMGCETAEGFARFMAGAEDWGRQAGERFYTSLKSKDPVTAEIFRKIAEEEQEHIELASRFFPN